MLSISFIVPILLSGHSPNTTIRPSRHRLQTFQSFNRWRSNSSNSGFPILCTSVWVSTTQRQTQAWNHRCRPERSSQTGTDWTGFIRKKFKNKRWNRPSPSFHLKNELLAHFSLRKRPRTKSAWTYRMSFPSLSLHSRMRAGFRWQVTTRTRKWILLLLTCPPLIYMSRRLLRHQLFKCKLWMVLVMGC